MTPWNRAGWAVALLSVAGTGFAAVDSYTDPSAFVAAATGLGTSTSVDFESVAPGTLFGPGTGPAGAGFTLDGSFGGGVLTPMVANTYWTTSGQNYLGLNSTPDLNSDTQFANGDVLNFHFAAPTRAFGLYVIGTSDLKLDGVQVTLDAGASHVDTAKLEALSDGNGSFAFFIGLVATTPGEAFTSATLTGVSPGFMEYAIDDVALVQAVPEPSTAMLALAGLLVTAWTARRPRRPLA